MTGGPPPGIGGPPGLAAAPGLLPPSVPPSPTHGAPPSPTHGAGAELEDSELKREILARIGGQVQQLLLRAKQESEAKVKAELRILHNAMSEMDTRLDTMINQLDEFEVAAHTAQGLEQATVVQALAKVEQQWGKELGKLKGELHQTIFAHNHNADLMKHQKDTLDSIKTEIDERTAPLPERLKAAKVQLMKIDQLYKGQQKQRRLEPLMQRMAALEQKIATAWRWPGGLGQASTMGKFQSSGMPPALLAAQQSMAAQQNMAARANMMAAMSAKSAAAQQATAFYSQAKHHGAEYAAADEQKKGHKNNQDDEDEMSLEQVLARALAAASGPGTMSASSNGVSL